MMRAPHRSAWATGRRSCQRSVCAAAAAVLACVAAPATVAAPTCSVTALPVAFGTYNPASATPRNASGRVTLTCSAAGTPERVSATIALSSGAGGSFSPRTLRSGANLLNYNLFTSNTYTLIWGDGGSSTRLLTVNLNVPANASRTANRTVFGRIPAAQDPVPGAYADTIVVTVTY
jgi:spore coat protein U-like protein